MIAPARYKSAPAYLAYLEAVEENPMLRVEFIYGEIVMSPSPRPVHQIVSRNLITFLHLYAQRNRLGEVLYAPLDVELAAEEDIVQPDIIFIRAERVKELIGEQRISGVPDMLVEILSPGTARIDRRVKLPLYARHGVLEYWIVDTDDEAVEIYTLAGDSYRVAGTFQAGDTIDVGQFAAARITVGDLFEQFS